MSSVLLTANAETVQVAAGTARFEAVVIGGAGHVGAPLAIALASRGVRTLVYDVRADALRTFAAGALPFMESGGEKLLARVLDEQMLGFAALPSAIASVPYVIITIGTPIDEYHNPQLGLLTDCIDVLLPYLDDSQTIVLRSTVSPGVTEFLDRYLRDRGRSNAIAFCPERVVQGNGIEEIQILPQLISGIDARALRAARELFERIAPAVIEMSPREAEFAKLITNAYRYITFAAANQFYMMVEAAGLDYIALLEKMKQGYPRMSHMPGPGFAAGPCLMKDTMQLFFFGQHMFSLGHEAMQINEGLPNFIVKQIGERMDLAGTTVGILGMTFKGESDDIRDSLAFKLRKILLFEGCRVLCSDEYVDDPTFLPAEDLVAACDVLVVGAPHKAYRQLSVGPQKQLWDVWNVIPRP